MSAKREIRAEFVELMPKELGDGILYISIQYATAIHLCCCGCGNKVVTPFSPTDWRLIFDGESVSLDPSIGNWNFPCQSHYWIERNQIDWAPRWTRSEIDEGRRKDRALKQRTAHSVEVEPPDDSAKGALQRLRDFFWSR